MFKTLDLSGWSHEDLNGRPIGKGIAYEQRCFHCGLWFKSSGPYFSSGAMPRDEALRYCKPCLTEYDWTQRRLMPQPYKTPRERPCLSRK